MFHPAGRGFIRNISRSLGQSCSRVVNETAKSLEITVKREKFEENLCEEEAIYISSSSETEEIVDIDEIF